MSLFSVWFLSSFVSSVEINKRITVILSNAQRANWLQCFPFSPVPYGDEQSHMVTLCCTFGSKNRHLFNCKTVTI